MVSKIFKLKSILTVILITLFIVSCSSADKKNENQDKNISTENNEVNSRSIKSEGDSGCINGNCNDGTGTYVWEDGSRYIGDWKNGKRDGKGVYIWASGDKYTGQFLNGDCHGDGVYLWANNAGYEGSWVNGKKEGTGKYTWPNGQIYEGTFKEGKIVTEKPQQ